MFLEILQNSQENTYARVACNIIKKETLALVFSCEFCGISKNIFFTEHLWTTASVTYISNPKYWCTSKSTFYHKMFVPRLSTEFLRNFEKKMDCVIFCFLLHRIYETMYSRMNLVKFVEDSL